MSVTGTSVSNSHTEIRNDSKRNALIQLSIIIAIASFIGGLIGTTISVTLIILFNKIENKSLNSLGFKQQKNWIKLIVIAFGMSFVIQLFLGIVSVIVYLILQSTADTSLFNNVEGNLWMFLRYLVISWTFAAFGEEVIWRGFFITKVALLFDNSRVGWGVAIILSGLAFGALHLYQGLAGAIVIVISGMTLATIFLRSKQNLWLCILIHGFMDTIGFTLLFLGFL